MSTEAKIEPLMTTADVAAILKCSEDHVADLYRAGKLHAAPIGVKAPATGRPGRRMLRFRPGDVRAFVESQLSACDPKAGVSAPAAAPVAAPAGDSLLRGRRR